MASFPGPLAAPRVPFTLPPHQMAANGRGNVRIVANSSLGGGGGGASDTHSVPFPRDYSELLKQAKRATELALADQKQLMEIEFPTAGLQSVPGDGEGGIEMTESIQLIRDYCDRLISPEKAARTRIFFPEASEVDYARRSIFGGALFKLDYLTKPSFFEDLGFVRKVNMAERVKPEDELYLVAYPYFNVNEMLVVEELYREAVVNTPRKLIIFNGELDRIRSGYYPAFFYPKLSALTRTLLPKMETVYYIHNFKGRNGGTLYRCYPGPCKTHTFLQISWIHRNQQMMENATNAGGLGRAKSDQLVLETSAVAAMKSPIFASHSSGDAAAYGGGSATAEGGSALSRKSSRRLASPARSSGSRNTHIRKTRSAQLKIDIDDVSSGAALSRASSASLGFSFSFTGFVPPDDIVADSRPFSDDDDIPEDLEASMRKKITPAEPTLPIYLKFKDVSYKIVFKGVRTSEEKDILNGITGAVSPGEVLALMGPSGSGKTTLLSILGGRLNVATKGGTITYNDQPYSKSLKSRIGFVTQDDVLFPHLTVRETLTYAALLRLPKALAKEQKEKRAIDVIYELGLDRCQDTMIGGSFVRGVSGGERKRVCIGNEILINPSLLLLDEPTSGLDSTTALRIVQMLQDIAEAGKTVITTIHQPSSRLFHKFDKLILLGKGSLLYYGKASEAMVYFSSIGCTPLIAMNPAEFLLDLANGNINDVSMPSELEDKVQIGMPETRTRSGKPSAAVVHEYLVEAYETRVAEKEKKKLMVPIPIDEELKAKFSSPRREWGATWFEQYSILFRRGFKERKNDYFSWLRITQVLATAVVLGLLWWQSDSKTPRGLQDQAGLLFFISVFWGFFPIFTAIFTFPQERAMLNKERAADMYRLSAYFVARTTSDIPLDLLLPVLFLLVVYFMAGLRLTADCFFLSMLSVFLCIIAAQGLGLAIGATLMDLKRATTLASVTVMTFMLAGGYFVRKVPVFISWIRYISFNYHTYKLLLKVQYKHMAPTINGMTIDSGVKEVTALIVMVFGYRILAYLSLRRMKLQPGS